MFERFLVPRNPEKGRGEMLVSHIQDAVKSTLCTKVGDALTFTYNFNKKGWYQRTTWLKHHQQKNNEASSVVYGYAE